MAKHRRRTGHRSRDRPAHSPHHDGPISRHAGDRGRLHRATAPTAQRTGRLFLRDRRLRHRSTHREHRLVDEPHRVRSCFHRLLVGAAVPAAGIPHSSPPCPHRVGTWARRGPTPRAPCRTRERRLVEGCRSSRLRARGATAFLGASRRNTQGHVSVQHPPSVRGGTRSSHLTGRHLTATPQWLAAACGRVTQNGETASRHPCSGPEAALPVFGRLGARSSWDPCVGWRWRWDLNPRWACTHTRFRGVLLRPLGHATAGEATRATTWA
jgi:hypothetical protein